VTGERANMAAFLDLDLLPVVDELGALAREVVRHAWNTKHYRTAQQMADRIDALHHGTLELWRDLLTEPAQDRPEAGQQ
jgi:hypothetical protein